MEHYTPIYKIRLSRLGFAVAVFAALVALPAQAQMADDIARLEPAVVAVVVNMSDDSQRQGQALVVSNHRNGIIMVTANSLVRSDVPDLRARNISILAGGDEAEVSLAEFRDRKNNLALLFLPDGGPLSADQALYDCAPEAGAISTTVDVAHRKGSQSEMALTSARRTSSGQSITMPASEGRRLLGAPVVDNGAIVGLINASRITGLVAAHNLLPISEVISFLTRYRLRFALEPSPECVINILPIPQAIRDLRTTIANYFSPDRTWYDIYLDLGPSTPDLVGLFGQHNAGQAKQKLKETLEDTSFNKKFAGVKPNPRQVLTNCYQLDQRGVGEYYGLALNTNDGYYCNALWDGLRLKGFFFHNQRWVWLP